MPIGEEREGVSHIAQAYPDRVEVRGRDLCGDLMGRVSFTEYFHLLLTGREPTDDQRISQDQAYRIRSDELFSDQQRLCQSVRPGCSA